MAFNLCVFWVYSFFHVDETQLPCELYDYSRRHGEVIVSTGVNQFCHQPSAAVLWVGTISLVNAV